MAFANTAIPESRVIKFRFVCRRIDDGKISMVYHDIRTLEHGDFKINEKWELIDRHQFTGLHDKNGKEIYEVDIISSLYRRDGCEGVYEVRWNEDGGCFYGRRHGVHQQKGVFVTPSDWTRCEVIGNIYENPELIKSNET